MNSVLVKLRIMFAFLGILVVIFALLHEGNFLVTGHWAGNIEILYWANTFSILLTIGGIYLAVKLLSVKKIHRRFFKKNKETVLRVWFRLEIIRMLLIFFVVMVDLYIYYATLEVSGGLCALMTLLAAFFCWPVPFIYNTEDCNPE